MSDDSRYLSQDDGQADLFEAGPDWEAHWQGMPEYVQEKQEPYQKIIVRFSCKQDVEDFAALLGQRITPQTTDLWHPSLIVKKAEKVIEGT